MRLQIKIPKDLSFEDLKLTRNSNGDVSFCLQAVAKIEEASGLPKGFFVSHHADNISEIFVRFYEEHIKTGGDADPVMVELLKEVVFEDMEAPHKRQ